MNSDQNENIINFMVPIAVAAGTFLIALLLSILVIDTVILKLPSEGNFLFEFLSYGLIILVYTYCLNYSRKKLGYFSDPKIIKHIFLIILVPALFGIYSGYESYKSKKDTILKNPP